MSAGPPSTTKLWWRWKSLRLPWRKRWLVGFDLGGNTFWEFKDQINAGRLRRIVEYSNSRVHYADVQVSPQWVQWLRHTRSDPPSIIEQQLDLIRQAQMKQLAAAADARWASIPSALKTPSRNSPNIIADPPNTGGTETGSQSQIVKNTRNTPKAEEVEIMDDTKQEKKASPWQTPKFGKEGEQQPESWTPTLAKRR